MRIDTQTIGMPRSDAAILECAVTPALVVDWPVLVRNVAEMASRASAAGVALRPHAKTHKCAAIAQLQIQAGATGFTVATLAEAEYFADSGFDDLLLANSPIGDWRIERLASLAARARVTVVIDSMAAHAQVEAAGRRASQRIDYLWEIDVGLGRSGTPGGAPAVAAIRDACAADRHARFVGLMSYPGHAYRARDRAELASIANAEAGLLASTARSLAAFGIQCATLSAGSTPTSQHVKRGTAITELRPGNYVFHDATQVALEVVPQARCALSVLGTVMSRPDPRRLVLDCGSKALAAERMTDRTAGFGFVLGEEGIIVERLYEEHAVLVSPEPCELRVGERVRVVPNHACAAANLHREMLILNGGGLGASVRSGAHHWA
jgi:D-serine deaminase-like pyridoxal phosphate-dependent protein